MIRLRALLWVVTCAAAACDGCPGRPATPTSAPPAWINTEMVTLPGGTFFLGAVDHDKKARDCERPRHKVTVSPFRLDRTEVTVRAYAEAVKAKVVPGPSCPTDDPKEQKLCNGGKADRADHPVNGVSWIAATAYCRWLGRRLPTEAEFEYVLRGQRDDAIFPWGNDEVPPPNYGNMVGEESEKVHPLWARLHGYRDGYIGTSPVGTFDPNEHGLYDITGNVWEWCSDWYGETYYAVGPKPRVNPRGPKTGKHRILKGGGFHCQPEELRIAERHHKKPTDDSFYSGFRRAKDVNNSQ